MAKTIADLLAKCKAALAGRGRRLLAVPVLLLALLASFALGYQAGEGGGQGSLPLCPVAESSSTEVVASRTGTKYYLPWCGGASRISAGNLVRFASPNDARAAGYAPAGNCDGL